MLCCFSRILIMLVGLFLLILIDNTTFSHTEVLGFVDILIKPAVFDFRLYSLVTLPYLEGLCGPTIIFCILVQLEDH